jgi:hypothetical protein
VTHAVLAVVLFAPATGRPAAEEALVQLIQQHGQTLLRGYRLPGAHDIRDDWAEYGNYVLNPPHRVSADFNGDGMPDHAFILVSQRGYGVRLAALVSSEAGYRAIKLQDFDAGNAYSQHRYLVQVVPPGRYQTARGKGYEAPAEDPDELVLEHPALDFIYTESANSYYCWDTKSRAFREILISE